MLSRYGVDLKKHGGCTHQTGAPALATKGHHHEIRMSVSQPKAGEPLAERVKSGCEKQDFIKAVIRGGKSRRKRALSPLTPFASRGGKQTR